MRKIFFLFAIIFFTFVLLSGCTGFRRRPQVAEPIEELELRTGSQGLVFDFLPNAPPDEMFTPEKEQPPVPLVMVVELANKGASNIVNGFFTLAVERDYVTVLDWRADSEFFIPSPDMETASFVLGGKSRLNPEGERDFMTMNAEVNALGPQIETFTTTILLTSCYGYQTLAVTNICVDTDVFGKKIVEKVCTVHDRSLTDQGAPIAVTLVEEKILPQGTEYIKPQFTIRIRNVGDGNVINKDRVRTGCSSAALTAEDFNVVTLEEVRFSDFRFINDNIPENDQIECTPLPLRLKEGEDFVRCTLKENLLSAEQPAFESLLTIKLGYGYMSSKSRSVVLKKIIE
ncbi:hypothetical protein KY339_03915 [Candidatus Woesearchaeota archaeon]|nr:hypothetical protein [Candidatus Woesearchaeota archaeon]